MKLFEVNDRQTEKDFLYTPHTIYSDENNWVCPLDKEIRAVFDPEKNTFQLHGDAKRWVLKDINNQLVGRIAAFFDSNKAYTFEQPTGGIGFFECVDNQTAANLLFDTARKWLQQEGMEAMDGPINFGRHQKYWGLLVDGFSLPTYGMNYNRPYYKNLFENYGFQVYFKQYSYRIDLEKKFPERFWRIAEWVSERPEYRFKHFRIQDKKKFVKDIVRIYNQAWGAYKDDLTPLRPEDVESILRDRRPVVDEDFIWIAYHGAKPIAFVLMFPDFNQVLQYFSGSISGIHKLRFHYLKWNKTITRTRIPVIGLLPKYENKGIEAAIFRNIKQVIKNKKAHYKEIELSWVADFEPYIIRLYESFGATISKQHRTYRFLFNRNKTFKRYPIPDYQYSV